MTLHADLGVVQLPYLQHTKGSSAAEDFRDFELQSIQQHYRSLVASGFEVSFSERLNGASEFCQSIRRNPRKASDRPLCLCSRAMWVRAGSKFSQSWCLSQLLIIIVIIIITTTIIILLRTVKKQIRKKPKPARLP